MRRAIATLLVLLPVAALAQPSAPPASNPGAAADAAAPGAAGNKGAQPITRAQFVQHAAEAAGRRFDAMDTTHAGVLTRTQMRAWRTAHHGHADH